jgi:hypothetical protein
MRISRLCLCFAKALPLHYYSVSGLVSLPRMNINSHMQISKASMLVSAVLSFKRGSSSGLVRWGKTLNRHGKAVEQRFTPSKYPASGAVAISSTASSSGSNFVWGKIAAGHSMPHKLRRRSETAHATRCVEKMQRSIEATALLVSTAYKQKMKATKTPDRHRIGSFALVQNAQPSSFGTSGCTAIARGRMP